jgi:DNA-binding MarR family transcriptional regulator
MKQPFEGLFGDTCESRLLQFLLPMYGIEFDMADLTEEIKLTRQSISKAMKKFSSRGMVTIRKEGRTWYYSINEESSLVKRLEDFDNSLIESVIGEEKFREIEKTHEKRMKVNAMEMQKTGAEKVTVRQDEEGGVIRMDFPGSSGSQRWWDDAKPKKETEIARPYSLTAAFPQIPTGSGAS